jgi:hypothetical protein
MVGGDRPDGSEYYLFILSTRCKNKQQVQRGYCISYPPGAGFGDVAYTDYTGYAKTMLQERIPDTAAAPVTVKPTAYQRSPLFLALLRMYAKPVLQG